MISNNSLQAIIESLRQDAPNIHDSLEKMRDPEGVLYNLKLAKTSLTTSRHPINAKATTAVNKAITDIENNLLTLQAHYRPQSIEMQTMNPPSPEYSASAYSSINSVDYASMSPTSAYPSFGSLSDDPSTDSTPPIAYQKYYLPALVLGCVMFAVMGVILDKTDVIDTSDARVLEIVCPMMFFIIGLYMMHGISPAQHGTGKPMLSTPDNRNSTNSIAPSLTPTF